MATGFTYEPGSTFKAFTVAAALEEHLVTPSTEFDLPVELQVADRTISDAEPRGPETLTVAQILAQSSNVGAVKIGLKVGAEHFYDWVRPFGFGQPTGVAFPGEEQGIVPTPRRVLGLDDGQPADRPGPVGDADADGGRLLGDRGRRHPARTAAGPRRGRPSRRGTEGPPRDQLQVRGADPDHARGRARAGRHRLRGQRARLHAGRQDGNRPGGRERHLLGDQVRRLLRRLRPGTGPASCWWRWWSTSRRASYYGGAVAAPAFGEIAKFALPYLGDSAGIGTGAPRVRALESAGMELRELLRRDVERRRGSRRLRREIAGLAYDSRRVAPGRCSSAFAGERADGHDFAPAAVEARRRGAGGRARARADVPQVLVADARAAMAPIAARFWGDPTAELRVAGITGTNGKTTTAFLVRHILEAHGMQTGCSGRSSRSSAASRRRSSGRPRRRSTCRRRSAGCSRGATRACAMEVSSHALALHRADAIHFAVAVFTNLTQDHLDFHADMEDYFRAKRLLFAGGGSR